MEIPGERSTRGHEDCEAEEITVSKSSAFYANERSIVSIDKRTELELYLDKETPDIIGTQNRNAKQNKLYAKDRFDLTYYCTNARSVFNKLTEVKHLVQQNNLKIIGITETWPSEEMTDAELHLEHFDLNRKDRIGRIGGGVMLYIHEQAGLKSLFGVGT